MRIALIERMDGSKPGFWWIELANRLVMIESPPGSESNGNEKPDRSERNESFSHAKWLAQIWCEDREERPGPDLTERKIEEERIEGIENEREVDTKAVVKSMAEVSLRGGTSVP